MHTEKTNRLLNRVAIVAGAGSRESPNNPDIVGNGRAASILLARAGAYVVLVDKSEGLAKKTQEMIENAPEELGHGKNRTIVIQADITSTADCQNVIKATVDKWDRLDILVNNVGIGGPDGSAVEVNVEEWRKAMDINVLGMVLMTKYAIPEMMRTRPSDISKGTGKAVVNMSSIVGLQADLQSGIPNLLYPTSKGAIINMTRAMAAHHGPDGIRINCVAPGTAFTPMVVGDGMSPALRETRKNLAPLRIEGYGWDIGNAIVFLVSDEARWITGAVLPVDAGRTAGQPGRPCKPAGSPPITKGKL